MDRQTDIGNQDIQWYEVANGCMKSEDGMGAMHHTHCLTRIRSNQSIRGRGLTPFDTFRSADVDLINTSIRLDDYRCFGNNGSKQTANLMFMMG